MIVAVSQHSLAGILGRWSVGLNALFICLMQMAPLRAEVPASSYADMH